MAITTTYSYEPVLFRYYGASSVGMDLAVTGDGFLVSRDMTGSTPSSIYFNTSAGTQYESANVSLDGPSVAALSSSQFVVAGSSGGHIGWSIVDRTGTVVSSYSSPDIGGNADVAVARRAFFTFPASNPDFYVAYDRGSDVRIAIYSGTGQFQRYVQVTATSVTENHAHIAVMSPEFGVNGVSHSGGIAMVFDRYDASNNPDDLMIAVYNADGSVRKAPTLLTSDMKGNSADITDYGSGFAVTWIDGDGDVRLATFDRTGSKLLEVTARANATGETLSNPEIDVLANGYIALSIDRSTLSPTGIGFVRSEVMMMLDPFKVGSFTFTGVKANQIVSVGGTNTGSDLVVTLDGNVVHAGITPDGTAVTTILHSIRTTTGDEAANTLTGDALIDRMYGNGGNDTIDGKGGADVMAGGAGNDTYYVDNVGDRVSEANVTGYDTIASTVSYSLTGQYVEHLYLKGSAAINATGNTQVNRLTGNAGANVLNAGAGDDVLTGNAGNDTLIGGTGSDSLRGDAGRDAFRFAEAPSAANADKILDYNVADDTIQLDNAFMPALGATTGVLAATKFVANTTGLATTTAQRLVYDTDDGRLYYDADGSGAAARILLATMTKHLALTNADFVVI